MPYFVNQKHTIGAFRTRLTLEALVETPDSAGGMSQSYTSVATLWGAIAARNGYELWAADRIEQNVSHQITIRYREGITAAHRFKLQARVFNIIALADPDGRKKYLVCHVEEVAP
jgi:SPP1 family predicted phage head-tail adaptor